MSDRPLANSTMATGPNSSWPHAIAFINEPRALGWIAVAVVLIAWEVAVLAADLNPIYLPRPTRMTAGAASFRSDNTVERQFEVIDPTIYEATWIPLGRDVKLEQVILARLKQCM